MNELEEHNEGKHQFIYKHGCSVCEQEMKKLGYMK